MSNSVTQSMNMAVKATSKDDLIVITGSFYIVSPAYTILEKKRIENEARNKTKDSRCNYFCDFHINYGSPF